MQLLGCLCCPAELSSAVFEDAIGCDLEASLGSEFCPWMSSWNRELLPSPMLLYPWEMQEDQAKYGSPSLCFPRGCNLASVNATVKEAGGGNLGGNPF